MNKKAIAVISGIIIFMVACVAFRNISIGFSEKKQKQSAMAAMNVGVNVAVPHEVETSGIIDSPGRVSATKTSDVICRAQGFILKQHFKEGDFVQEGQLLYTIDPNAYVIALDRAQASLEVAKANQYQAQKDFERAEELVKKDYISKSHYDQALATRDAANANVHAAKAAVNDARRLLNYTQVKAPISGKISQTFITVGNYLSSPNTVLTKIVSTDPIFVNYALDSKIYSQMRNDEIISNGKEKSPILVEVTLPDGRVYDKKGVADFTDNSISPTTGTINLRATFPNPDGTLIAGDFVNVKVHSNNAVYSLAVPQAAVLQDSEGRYLFVIDENNVAHKRIIEVSGQKGDDWLISSGIQKGEKFALSGIKTLREGAPVKILNNDENAPAKENKDEK